MRSLAELLAYLQQCDIQLWVEGEKLRYNAPKGALTPEIRNELKERKADLLVFLQHTAKIPGSRQIESIRPVPRDGNALPLSFNQEQLWIEDQLEGNKTIYNLPVGWRIFGPLNIPILEQSFSEIVRRHEALRTIFPTIQGLPMQKILLPWKVQFPLIDLHHFPPEQRDDEARRMAFEEIERPFDLAEGPLFRGIVLRLEPEAYIFVLSIHHIISDVWSVGILAKELTILYKAFKEGKDSPLSDISIQYADFASWQREWVGGQEYQSQLAYWTQNLTGIPPVLELPTDRPRPPERNFQHGVEFFWIQTILLNQLKMLSQKQGVTFFMTVLAAFAVILNRYSGQDDIVIGSPLAGRARTEVEPLIGFFINMLPFRIHLSGNPTFIELLAQVREVALNAYSHQDVPFVKLVETLHPERNLNYTPLVQVQLDLKSAPVENIVFPGLNVETLKGERGTPGAIFDLTLAMEETSSKLLGAFEYNANLFDKTTIKQIIRHFQHVLETVVQNPQLAIRELSILSEIERQELLVNWNDTSFDYPTDKCLHQLIERQVEKEPDATAVQFENSQLTYRELNQRANQVAHHLQKLGIGTDVLVGIYVERSLDMVIGLLGILKAGGAYVPLDPMYPKERIALMLEDSKLSVLLTQARLQQELPEYQAHILCLDRDWETIGQESEKNIENTVSPNHLAYVIYTSGSTGKPKGVQICHRSLVNFLHSMQVSPGLVQHDILLAVTTISFDIAALELYLPLMTGATIVLASSEVASDGVLLSKKLHEAQVTVMQATPATWRLLLASGWQGNQMLKILCGGEALPQELANQLLPKCSALWNMYGPTETTVWSTIYHVEPFQTDMPAKETAVSIGRPIANTQVYILDTHLQPVPIGVAGELHIGGDGLARGYRNRPELNAEKFIPDPFSHQPEARLYKTGDLARYLSDGNIEYLGRLDHQVKIRGFRIELGDIEVALLRYDPIREAVVIVREDHPNDKRLVAYLVLQHSQMCDISKLRNYLKEKLPDYMIPSAFVTLKELPLTPNGKVNRHALPAPEVSDGDHHKGYVAPRTPIETTLTAIWTEVLHVKQVGIYHNFFELGGHSLLATQVLSRIRDTFEIELPLRTLFQLSNISELAEFIVMKQFEEIEQNTLEQILAETSELSEEEVTQQLFTSD